jgi:hypothetical protein
VWSGKLTAGWRKLHNVTLNHITLDITGIIISKHMIRAGHVVHMTVSLPRLKDEFIQVELVINKVKLVQILG